MVQRNTNDMHGTSTTVYDHDMMVSELDALIPGQRQSKLDKFRKLYPSIERAMSRNVSQKAILATLKKCGFPLSPVTFKKMLTAERRANEAVVQGANGDALPLAATDRKVVDEVMIGTAVREDRSNYETRKRVTTPSSPVPGPQFGRL